MKISIIGAGMVGGAIANALVQRNLPITITLVDKERSIAEAQALDVNSASAETPRVTAGELEEVRDSEIIILAAGKRANSAIPDKQLLEMNSEMLETTLKHALEFAPNAIIINAIHPMDLMTHHLVQLLGQQNAARVLGTGTMLETNLLRQTIGTHYAVHPANVQGYVLGEQGSSALVAWSTVRVAGVSLAQFLEQRHTVLTQQEQAKITEKLQNAVKGALGRKGTFLFGVGNSVARIVQNIIENRHEILTVSAWSTTQGAVLSMPRVIGSDGVVSTITPILTPDEDAHLNVILGYFRATFANQVNS